MSKSWKSGDRISLTFFPKVQTVAAVNGELVIQYGPLLYALPISSTSKVVKTYPLVGFEHTYYEPDADTADALALVAEKDDKSYGFRPVKKARSDGRLRPFASPPIVLRGKMLNKATGVKDRR